MEATLLKEPLRAAKVRNRIESIDLLRGLVMIIMALDHTRDFFHAEAMTRDPMDVATTTYSLFFTRWITHFCAPAFVLLAGTSAWLQGLRKSKKELSIFLLTRGLWLIVAEITLVTFGISFDPSFSFVFLQVIWAIGVSMVVLSAAIWLPFSIILGLGLLIVFGHNILDYYEANNASSLSLAYYLLHKQAFLPIENQFTLAVLYPVLPWLGLMLCGYCLGKIFTRFENGVARTRVLVTTGVLLLLLFVLLRWLNSYGDPSPWISQPGFGRTLLSFLNTTKYPPSLQFLCMTIGPTLILLGLFEGLRNGITRVIIVYGKVPFFYYLLHFYLIHALSALAYLLRGHSFAEGATGVPFLPFKFVKPGEGLSLGDTYLVWIAVVALLYFPCRWFAAYKQKHRHWWLSYL